MRRRTVLGALAAGTAGAMLTDQLNASPMNDGETNKRVVQNLIQKVWREGQIDELPHFWSANCVNHADPSTQKQGLAAVRLYHEGFAAWFRDFEDVKIDVEQQIAEGDRVATQMLLRAVHTAKQRRVSLATIRIDRFTQGKIAEHWSIADMAGFNQQLD